jgi:hypothetical protein
MRPRTVRLKVHDDGSGVRTIYIQLLGEGTVVWRPVIGQHIEADIFEILGENSESADEHWEFNRGQRVRCRERITPEGETILIAYERSPN